MKTKMRPWVAGGAAVVVLVIAAGWFLLVSPKRSEAATVRAQATTQEAANATLRGQIAQLQAQAKGLVAKQAALQAVDRRVPSQPKLPGLIRGLYAARDRTGVDLVGITPGAPAAAVPTVPGAAPYQVIPVALQVQGDYSQMTLFLDELETLQRLYLVKTIQVSASKADPRGGKVTLGPDGTPTTVHTLLASIAGEVYTTSSDTTDVSLPALTSPTAPAGAAAAPGAPAPVSAPPAAAQPVTN